MTGDAAQRPPADVYLYVEVAADLMNAQWRVQESRVGAKQAATTEPSCAPGWDIAAARGQRD